MVTLMFASNPALTFRNELLSEIVKLHARPKKQLTLMFVKLSFPVEFIPKIKDPVFEWFIEMFEDTAVRFNILLELILMLIARLETLVEKTGLVQLAYASHV